MIISPGVVIGPNITISDPAPTPTYTLTPAANNVDEGSSLTFAVSGTSITNGTYYWTVTNSGDFIIASGSFVITNNSGSFEVSPTADNTEEGVETFTASIRSGGPTGPILQTSIPVTINDTSPPLSYTLTPAADNVNEGSSLTFNVGGTNITNGTYYWTIENNSGDFGTASGSFSITSNSGSFAVTPTADTTTEGSETFTVAIRSGSTTGPVLKISNSITINDTSLSLPTYTLTPTSNNVDEGKSLTFVVGGTNIPNGTYYWTVTNSGDFGTASGSFSITSNSGSFAVTPTADNTVEGSETFTASIRSGSTSGTVLQTSSSVTINDVLYDYAAAQNLVLYYDPSDAASYSGAGTTINDLSGNGLTGTMKNITYTDPYFSYNGTSSRIVVADNALFEPGSGDFTWEAWVYTSAPVVSGTRAFISKASTSQTYLLRILTSASYYNQLQLGIDTASLGPYSAATLTVNTWYHVVYVWKNVSTNSLEIFVNGVRKVNVSHSVSSAPNNSGPLCIGAFSDSSGATVWLGRIGLVRLYNTALTSSDVTYNFNGSKATYGL